MPDSVKSSIAFAFSSFFIKGIVFLMTPIFTRIMDLNDYGIITTYNSWLSIIEVFALLGLTSAGVFNVGLNDNKENRNKYISICLGLCNTSTILFFTLILLLKMIYGTNFLLENKYLIVMFIHFIFSPAQIFWITRQKYEYKYKLATIITIVSVLMGQVLALLGVFMLKNNEAFGKIIGNEVGTLCFSIPIFYVLLKKGKKYIDKIEWKKVLVLAIPLIPHYLSQHIMASSDKIMISNMVNSGDAAIYGVVANIGMIGTILWTAINGSLVPFTFESMNNKKTEKIKDVSKYLILSYFAVCILIMLVAPEILNILAPKEYYKGIHCVPSIVMVVFLQALYNLYANIEFYYKKTKRIAVATVIATIINVVLNYMLIPKYSFVAAAYTTLISYIVLVMIHYFNYRKCSKENIYNNRFILGITLSLLLISLICNFLYNFTSVIRYVIIILIIILLFLKKEKLRIVLNQIK